MPGFLALAIGMGKQILWDNSDPHAPPRGALYSMKMEGVW
jgi:hypothetical protein